MDIKLKTSDTEHFVKDFGLATALVTQEVKLLRLEKDPSGFFWFVFPSGKSNELADSYWSDELLVPARKYNIASKSLKNQLFSQKTFG